ADAPSSMFAEANDLKVKPVLEVLRAPDPLSVNLGLTNKTLSDQGRADAVEKLDQACPLDYSLKRGGCPLPRRPPCPVRQTPQPQCLQQRDRLRHTSLLACSVR